MTKPENTQLALDLAGQGSFYNSGDLSPADLQKAHRSAEGLELILRDRLFAPNPGQDFTAHEVLAWCKSNGVSTRENSVRRALHNLVHLAKYRVHPSRLVKIVGKRINPGVSPMPNSTYSMAKKMVDRSDHAK